MSKTLGVGGTCNKLEHVRKDLKQFIFNSQSDVFLDIICKTSLFRIRVGKTKATKAQLARGFTLDSCEAVRSHHSLNLSASQCT